MSEYITNAYDHLEPHHGPYPTAIMPHPFNRQPVFSTLGRGPRGKDSFHFADPIEWDINTDYPSHTVVKYNNNTYITKQDTPAGTAIDNEDYWALWYAPDATMRDLDQRVDAAFDGIQTNYEAIQGIWNDEVDINQAIDTIEDAAANLNEAVFGLTTQDGGLVRSVHNLEHSSAELIFAPIGAAEDVTNSDCTIIKTPNGKVLMFDTEKVVYWNQVLECLRKHSINHIDYLVISHYHSDHIGNCRNLVNAGYINESTVSYLPRRKPEGIDIAGWGIEADAWEPLSVCNQVIIPTTSTVIDVDGIHVEFFNCDAEDYEYYNNHERPEAARIQNSYCICNRVTFGDNRILLLADIEPIAQDHVIEQGHISKCDIMKIPHHGFNSDRPSLYFLSQPDIGIVNVSSKVIQDGYDCRGLKSMRAYGIKAYVPSPEEVCIRLLKTGYFVTYGAETSWYAGQRDNTIPVIYVSNSYDGQHSDGSSLYPYPTVRHAVYRACFMNVRKVIIRPLDGYTYEREDEIVTVGSSIPIIEIDDCTIGRIYIENSSVELNNVVVALPDEDRAVNVQSASLRASNLVVSGSTRSASDVASGRGIALYRSNAFFADNLEIDNKRCAIWCDEGSTCTIAKLSGSNNEHGLAVAAGSSVGVKNVNDFLFSGRIIYSASGIITGAVTGLSNYHVRALANGEDLNDLKNYGTYRSISRANAASLVNKPAAAVNASFVIVENIDFVRVLQTYRTVDFANNPAASTVGQWVRTYSPEDTSIPAENEGWTDWVKQF